MVIWVLVVASLAFPVLAWALGLATDAAGAGRAWEVEPVLAVAAAPDYQPQISLTTRFQ